MTPRKLKYGQHCYKDNNDTCTFGAVCIDSVCKCAPGYALNTNGWCEPFNFIPVSDNHSTTSQIPHAAPSESCENGEMCTGGSICDGDSKTCVCAANHVIKGGVCGSKGWSPVWVQANFQMRARSLFREDLVLPERNVPGTRSALALHVNAQLIIMLKMVTVDILVNLASQSSPVKFSPGNGLQFISKLLSPRVPAKRCDEASCRLPECFCSVTGGIQMDLVRTDRFFHFSGRKPPGGLAPNTVPQFVVLTFDDAVNGRTLPDYLELFETVKYRNPNGCPVKGTFFVSHEWTNYDAVQWLFQQGMELASNSISHVSLEKADANRWLNEMDGQRRIIAKFANTNEEEIIGLRAPQLVLGGDEQFEMMANVGFVYDNSMSVNPGINGEPYWPQTLDYAVPWDCYDAQCPTASFPGLWAIPLNQFYGSYIPQIDAYRRSSMVRAAVDLNTTVDQLTNMLFSNFDRSYLGNRAPFVLSLNADLLQLNGKNTGMQALQRFLEEVLYRKDVYVVTLKQLIQWMQHPLPLNQMLRSDAVKCPQSFNQHATTDRKLCLKPNKCMYNTPGLGSQEHQFLTCSPCPDQYPWLDNPLGYAFS
ncbi:unnamed protein product [Haemonchus placei]|uniref:Uncharacterized protein n=2 Tax=Haemonchus TaxID=6288 RepID=A0A3P7ZWL9_HAEPC|nr:unnamed protein product [Haemonchus placei]